MVKQATESPAEFRFPPPHTVRRRDAFLTICRLFFFPARDFYFVSADPRVTLYIWLNQTGIGKSDSSYTESEVTE